MGKITVKIDDALEQQFRTAIAMRGGKKGDLSKTIEAAVNLWLQTNSAPADAG